MSKRLLIMRHGEAEPAHASRPDRERVLTLLGKERSLQVGMTLKSENVFPQLILTSHAVRAKQTVESVLVGLGVDDKNRIPVVQIEDFFGGGADIFVAEMGALPESVHTVLVVAHNPWLSDVVGILSGHSVELAPGDLSILVEKNPDGREWAELVTSARMWLLENL